MAHLYPETCAGATTLAPVTERSLSLFARLWLGWILFFRVLFDRAFAERARALGAGEAPRPAELIHAATPPEPAAAADIPDPLESARMLLRLLQRDGRLVDFLQQDITSFADAEVGAAARVVHEGCRRVLRAHAKVSAVRSENEGSTLTLDAAEAERVKLVGEVSGKPPYRGILRHRGWHLDELELPTRVGSRDSAILAEAEVELG
jgi:hypothetical protein